MAAAFQKVLEVVIRGDEADATRALGQMQRQIESLGRRADRVGRQLTRGLTLPIAGAVAVALRAGTQFDNAFSVIERRTGAQGAALQALRNDFRQVFRDVPEDARTVAEAIGDINTRLGLVGEPLQRTTQLLLAYSRVNEEDVATSTRTVSRLLNALGWDASRLPEILDKLTLASQRSGIGVNRLAQLVIDAGPAFEEMGFGLDRAIALFAEMEAAGARPEEVIGSLNIALTRLARSGASNAEEAFSRLLQEIRDAPNILRATEIAADAFGSRVGAKIAEDIRAGRFEVEAFVAALEGAGGTLERTDQNTRTLGDRLRRLKNRAMEAGEPIGTQLVGALERAFPHLERGVDMTGRLIDRFMNLPAPVLATAAALTALAAAGGPAFMMVSSGIRTFSALLTIVGTLAGPAGIAKLVAAFTTLGGVVATGGVLAVGLGATAGLMWMLTNRAREAVPEVDRLRQQLRGIQGELAGMDRAALVAQRTAAAGLRSNIAAAVAETEAELDRLQAIVDRAGPLRVGPSGMTLGEPAEVREARSQIARHIEQLQRLKDKQRDVIAHQEELAAALAARPEPAAAPGPLPGGTGPATDAIDAAVRRAEKVREVLTRLERDLGAAERQAAVLGDRFNLDAAHASAYEAAIRDLARAGVELGQDVAGTGLTLEDLAERYDVARRADEALADQMRREDAIRNRIRALEDQNRALRLSVVELSAHELAVLGASEAQQRYARFLADANEELEWQRRVQEEAAGAVERAADRSGAAADELRARYDMVARTAERMAQRTVDAWTDMTEGLFGRVRRMVDAVLEELARLWAAQHILDPLTRLFGGFLGGTIPAAPAAARAPAGPGLFGFQHGGSFTVGGTGPADSKLVAFMATPGEEVDVRTPGQAAAAQGNTFNVTTPITIVTPDVVTMRQWVRRNRDLFAEEVLAGLQDAGF